jgi:hypothetical protein
MTPANAGFADGRGIRTTVRLGDGWSGGVVAAAAVAVAVAVALAIAIATIAVRRKTVVRAVLITNPLVDDTWC